MSQTTSPHIDPRRSTSELRAENSDESLSILRASAVVLRHWKTIVLIPLLFALVAIAAALLRKPTYTSTVAFVPQGGQSAQSQLSGLASQFGVTLSGGENAGQSPRFYELLIKTADVLGAAVDSTYTFQREGKDRRGTLIDVFDVEGRTEALRRARAIRKLKDALSTTTDKETGIVRLSVQTPWATVSQQVAKQLIALVNAFNLEQRRLQAAAEREFVEARLADSRAQLRSAEDELEQFLERNRQYTGDPRLVATHERLERTISLRQQVYMSLSQMYEQASLASLRDTPLIAVVEQPRRAVEADPRGLIAKTILAFVLGVIVAVCVAFSAHLASRARVESPEDAREVGALYRQLIHDIRGFVPWGKSSRA